MMGHGARQLKRLFLNPTEDDMYDHDFDYNGPLEEEEEGYYRSLAGGDAKGDDGHGDDGGGHGEFGVHITYEDLYAAMIFFTAIYVAGVFASRVLKMPSLVGEIFAGIILGPPLADYIPNPEAFVLLGEIGLILLVLEAGIDIDLSTLSLIGTRGIIIAIIGSIAPIAIALAIAFALGFDTKASIAAGATFGPTSLGIAMNILRQGKIVNTPVGQLIVSAAVIDDMIALIILSQLSALEGDATVAQIVAPIVSALGFLIVGGYIAVFIFPKLINATIMKKVPQEQKGKAEMIIMFALILALMPATYYAKASFLMGVFIAGLAFCRSHDLHHLFVTQFKRLMQWLMRIFFAASIGFQVPIKDFGNGTVIWQGLVFTLALLGKIGTGLLVPNFTQSGRFQGFHLRDVFVTGFSMAAEGEFAFVIAVFAVDSGLITKDLYASVVLAVLISTILPPFALRYTINRYNKKSEDKVQEAIKIEYHRQETLEHLTEDEREKQLRENILNDTTLFLCIQIQCKSAWGILPTILTACQKLGLEIIDNRSWHPRGIDTTMVNEIYASDPNGLHGGESVADRLSIVQHNIFTSLRQNENVAKVKVTRWMPGILKEITEEVTEEMERSGEGGIKTVRKTIRSSIAMEATKALESKRQLQLAATKERTVDEILGADGIETEAKVIDTAVAEEGPKKRKRVRQKMRSTPVTGGSLFDDDLETPPAKSKQSTGPSEIKQSFMEQIAPHGKSAELVIGREVFKIRISPETVARIRRGYSGSFVDDGGIQIAAAEVPVETRLHGFIRTNQNLARIVENNDTSEFSDAGTTDDFQSDPPGMHV
uniref:Cation/H+ exchanger transmembrane domain-containing protein n=1 Tax=Ditylum brightwellii TaxID=49249 RepID=A0A7S1Z7Y7_9STRA|mmetsp:Transcript_26459/g.39285  ORF Transcript_26459/g.39285 Transcript_26459/m.39285 type:complete len:825 (+) Transcript_26459:294-2768(+)